MSFLKIGGATVNQTPLDWEGNFQNIKLSIEERRASNLDLKSVKIREELKELETRDEE
jgi:hypothetical protein